MNSFIPSLAIVAALLAAQAASPAPSLSWQRTPNSLALTQGGHTLWQFNYGTNESKPCFHPVRLADGPELTWYRPADHPWHRALWFSWKFINGVNYWEEDPKTGIGAGRTEWKPPQIQLRPDFSARIELDLSYRPADGKAVLTEHRVIEVRPPNSDGVLLQDWSCTFTAAEEVKLDRTPLPNEPEGKPYGGYAGLSVRLVKCDQVEVHTAEQSVEFAGGRFRGKSAGMDYSGVIEGKEFGVAILDHRQNLNAPSPWYAINDGPMRYFSPAVICYQPHGLRPGEQMTLNYRVLIHPGRWDSQQLRRALAAFQP